MKVEVTCLITIRPQTTSLHLLISSTVLFCQRSCAQFARRVSRRVCGRLVIINTDVPRCTQMPIFIHTCFSFTVCAAKADIGFIVDQSTSIVFQNPDYSNWYSCLSFIQQVIQSFRISPSHTRVGLIRFNNTAQLEYGFTTYTDSPSLMSAVSNLKLEGGNTSYTAAFRVANNQLWTQRRQNVQTICIFITDGQPNIDTDQTYDEINVTKALGIQVFAIGVTNKVCMRHKSM